MAVWHGLRDDIRASSFFDPKVDDLSTQRSIMAASAAVLDRMVDRFDELHHGIAWMVENGFPKPPKAARVPTFDVDAFIRERATEDDGLKVAPTPQPARPRPGGIAVIPELVF